jgi:hypothetical protein
VVEHGHQTVVAAHTIDHGGIAGRRVIFGVLGVGRGTFPDRQLPWELTVELDYEVFSADAWTCGF